MAKKKVVRNNDAKEVASKQKSEMSDICRVFLKDGKHLSMDLLKSIMLALGKNGKMCRSRRNIYVGIRAHGFVFTPRVRKKKVS